VGNIPVLPAWTGLKNKDAPFFAWTGLKNKDAPTAVRLLFLRIFITGRARGC
jgi:hypothetical protein